MNSTNMFDQIWVHDKLLVTQCTGETFQFVMDNRKMIRQIYFLAIGRFIMNNINVCGQNLF